MARHARASKRDENEPEIVAALRDRGCNVVQINGSPGFPDLVVGRKGETLLIEVKNPLANQSGTCLGVEATSPGGDWDGMHPKLEEEQARFIRRWRGGPIAVVETVNQALAFTRFCAECERDLDGPVKYGQIRVDPMTMAVPPGTTCIPCRNKDS